MKRTILLVIGVYLSLAMSGCSRNDETADGEQTVSLQDMAAAMSKESTVQPESAQGEAQPEDVSSETAVGADTKESSQTAGDPAAIDIHERNLDEIKEYLSRFSGTLQELSEEECYVILHGKEYSGREYLNAFLENVEEGVPDELVFAEFTVEGDPVLTYLNYDSQSVYRVLDSSRDAWIGNGEKYSECNYDSVWIAGEADTEGNYYLSLYALQEQDMVIELFRAATDILPEWAKPPAL